MRTVKHFRLHDWFAVEYCELDQFGLVYQKQKYLISKRLAAYGWINESCAQFLIIQRGTTVR